LRVAYIIAIVVIVTFLLIKKFARHEIYASYSFNGKVQFVKYLYKGATEVTIKRKTFLLDFDVRRQIEQGDSLCKKKVIPNLF
jgi:hypothetical protein